MKFEPLLIGGEQERKRRAGTENVPSIAGLQHAILIAEKTREQKMPNMKSLKI